MLSNNNAREPSQRKKKEARQVKVCRCCTSCNIHIFTSRRNHKLSTKNQNLKTKWEKKQKQIKKGPRKKSTKYKNEEKKKTRRNYKKQDSSQFNLGWVCG